MRASVLVVAILLAWSGSVSTQGQPPPPPDPAKVKAGAALYVKLSCDTCHSIEGKGNTRYPLDGVGTRLSVDDIRLWMTDPAQMEAKLKAKPRLSMVPYMRSKKLTVEDLDAIVAHMQSLR